MPIRTWIGALGAAALGVALSGCAQPMTQSPSQVPSQATSRVPSEAAAIACAAPLQPALEVNLYFGRGKPAGGEVSDTEWASFLSESVTPHFPAGLSVFDLRGQHRDPAGRITGEATKLLTVVVFDAPAHRARVASIVAAYNGRFGQHGVFRVERPVCAGG
jgi:hypothetical protein